MKMLPSLFLCHGAPSLAIEDNQYTDFLKQVSQQFDKPKAIVIFSAHWESDILSFTYTNDSHDTIYDFYGFPEALYTIKYPAKGSTEIAEKLQKWLLESGIDAQKEMARGLDHGAWVVLRLMYPNADIPVIGVSVNPKLSPVEQYKIGQSIRKLREEGILVIGSGSTVHNLRMLEWGKKTPTEWAVEFDDWLIDKVEKWDLHSLFSYEELAPHSRLAIPRNEHFVPLFIAMGSGDDEKKATVLHRSYDLGTLSLVCFQFN